MISLTLLLNELGVGEPSNAWKTPSGTPDEVIDVMHNIVAQIQMAGANPRTIITLNKIDNGTWVIVNLRKDFSIGYNEVKKAWAFSWKGQRAVEINDIQLKQIIDSWMK